jgi:hypothetical protein
MVRFFVSVRAELVEALSFRPIKQEGKPSDRLRANGFRRFYLNFQRFNVLEKLGGPFLFPGG